LSIINCRQFAAICGASVVPKFANTSASAVVRTVAGLTKIEKCSWNVSSTLGAPTFKITTASNLLPSDGSGYMLHYVEYGNTV
jgi:hypothetical protein